MRNFRKVNNLFGWIVFIIAAITFLSTMEGTASLWDCGEFITSTYKLEVGHPPGAPFFNILGRVLTLFSGSNAWTGGPSENAAVSINALSAISSALCILFLFWSITHIARRLLVKNGEELTLSNTIICIGAGLVGSLAYTFSDTFWFSAVEAEVYAMSSMFTALIFWLMLKWEDNADSPYSARWLVLIIYLMGLSMGVHPLGLLVIPAIALIYYFKKYTISAKGIIATLFISALLIVLILYGLMPGLFYVISRIDLFTTNSLNFPLHMGTMLFIIALFSSIVVGIYQTAYNANKTVGIICFTLAIGLSGILFFVGGLGGLVLILALLVLLFILPYNPKLLNFILTSILVATIGYSSFAMIIIRANANPPMNQNDPNDSFTFQSYLARDQYGSTPLIKGQSFSSIPIKINKDGYEYNAIDGKYVQTSEKMSYTYYPEKLFPRMYSNQPEHVSEYKNWSGMNSKNPGVKESYGQRSFWVPSRSQEISYFINYQINWMYWRYFFWNFSGRQNDTQGYGDPIRGNWITGIDFIDSNSNVGTTDDLPSRWKNDPTRNVYYMLPLILGLIGFLFQLFKKENGIESFSVILALFFMTGIAIVLYLNQPPLQPRERDYAYAGSFYAFAIWIGIGVLGIMALINKYVEREKTKRFAAILISVVCLGVPALMAKENWADHDRSRRSVANHLAYNYLMSCEKDAVIFTYGDNDTFPLWYLQEVEGVRTDIRVCNLSYFQIDWYIEQMGMKAYESDPLPFSFSPEQYRGDKLNSVKIIPNDTVKVNLQTAMKYVSDQQKRQDISNKRVGVILPANKFIIPVDVNAVIASGIIPKNLIDKVVPEVEITINKEYISKQELMMLDIFASNNWKRPIYFATSVGTSKHLGISEYLFNEGFAYRFLPVKNGGVNSMSAMNTDLMYDKFMYVFRYGGLNKPGYVLMDYQAIRMFISMRTSMVSLAQALLAKQENEKCLNIINKCLDEFPDRNLPLGYSSCSPYELSGLSLGDMLASLGKKEKGLALINQVAEQSREEIVWYLNQKPQLQSNQKLFSDMQRSTGVYRAATQSAFSINNDTTALSSCERLLNEFQATASKLNR